MTETEIKAPFKPDCVFFPEGFDFEDVGCCEDFSPVLLMCVGNKHHGELFTKEAYEADGEPSYKLRFGEFTLPDGEPLPSGKIDYHPEICVVKYDEREYYCPEIQEKTKAIWGVYIFDRRVHVHICSFEPNYECLFIGSQVDPVDGLTDEELEKLDDDVREGDRQCERYSYLSAHDVDRVMQNVCEEGRYPANGKSGGYVLEGLSKYAVTTEFAMAEAEESGQTWEF